MTTITIDGKALEFQAGETVIKVATRHGIDIPYYCWHPRLSVAANCRMCLVDIKGQPKLAPSCQAACTDGMVVDTVSDKVKSAQRAVHEFLLINHPIDCPICDQSGECKLQDYYMKYQLAPSRMDLKKVHKPRLEPLGPHVMYNAERCIVCTRCIRFMEEVPKDRQLGVFNRGDHSEIGVMPGESLDNPYSLNTVDVCPVGALTSRVFRFKQRVWNLRRSPSVCGGCARGCNTHVDQRAGRVYRMLPRDNEQVNQSWMCDEGRLTYDRANEGRLEFATVRRPDAVAAKGAEAQAQQVAPDTAVQFAAELLTPGRGRIAVVLSLHATLEETYVLARVAKEALQVDAIGLVGYPDGEGDTLLRVPDRNPNRRGILALLQQVGLAAKEGPALAAHLAGADGVLLVGHQGAAELAGACRKARAFVHIAHAHTPLADVADVTLPSLSWVQVDGTWVNVDGRAQRLRPAFAPEADSRPADAWLMALAERWGVPLTLPSAQTVRAEIARTGPLFAGITDVDLTGRVLGA